MKKFIGEIELCNFLINYCKNLYPKEQKDADDDKVDDVDVKQKLSEDNQWKKEKGLEVLQSKKSKQDDEPSKKKYKKPKKAKQ